MIPESEWEWFGHPGHLCVSDRCQFRLATKIGNYLVSTVGEYFPKGAREIDTLSGLGEYYYETLVFEAKERMECGCVQHNGRELDVDRYTTAKGAQAGHMAMCRKYAGTQ